MRKFPDLREVWIWNIGMWLLGYRNNMNTTNNRHVSVIVPAVPHFCFKTKKNSLKLFEKPKLNLVN